MANVKGFGVKNNTTQNIHKRRDMIRFKFLKFIPVYSECFTRDSIS